MLDLHYIFLNSTRQEEIIYDNPRVSDLELMVINTPSKIWVNGTLCEVPGHSAVLFTPGQYCCIHSIDGTYSEHRISFSCDEAFLTASFIPFGVPFHLQHPDNITDLLQLISFEHASALPSRTFALTQFFNILLHKLHDSVFSQVTSPAHFDLIRLHDEIYLHPETDWNIADMAQKLNMSPRYLHYAYKELFHISCINDVINSRVSHAQRLLEHTNFTVAEIAYACGYNNVEHFSRQFRQQTGIAPGEYRKKECAHKKETTSPE